jgi:hypothetical protein
MRFNKKETVYRKFNIHFFIIAIAIAVSIYIVLADGGKYTSKSNILLLPKNEKTAVQIDKIRVNLITIFKKTSKIEEDVINVKNEGTLISIEVKRYNKSESVKLSNKTSQEIINIASKYYSVKNDLDLKILKEETKKSENNIFVIILLSIVAGGVISFIIQMAVSVAEKLAVNFMKKRKDTSNIARDIEDVLMKNKSKIEELSYAPKRKENVVAEIPMEEVLEEEAAYETETNFKKASSPQNLPIESFENLENNVIEDDISTPNNLPLETISEIETQESLGTDDSQDSAKEPTEEEYRERLNQLLKGE